MCTTVFDASGRDQPFCSAWVLKIIEFGSRQSGKLAHPTPGKEREAQSETEPLSDGRLDDPGPKEPDFVIR